MVVLEVGNPGWVWVSAGVGGCQGSRPGALSGYSPVTTFLHTAPNISPTMPPCVNSLSLGP